MVSIYFADLTHTTIMISNDAFPLNVGLVAAYAKSRIKDVEIELFKYPEELKKALDRKLPDILALSNYPWNFDLGCSFMEYVKRKNPNIITVMGGPNMSYDALEQERLLQTLEYALDFYVMGEGERGFYELLQNAVNNNLDVKAMQESQIPGVLYLRKGRLAPFSSLGRNPNLEEYPSPYLTGVLDKFFDNKLSPMIETHRGCPFRCTYCHEGHAFYNKVNRFRIERVLAELDYIGDRIGGKVKNMHIADPNFGMFDSDVIVAEKMAQVKQRTGFPKMVSATTAKNSGKRLIDISAKMGDISMPVWMSVQSMTESVLVNIKRKNIKIDDMLSLQRYLAGMGKTSQSELIVPLPGETLESHLESLVTLIKLKVGAIACHQLMLVQGCEIKADMPTQETPQWLTKFRALPRNFSRIEGMRKAIETEEIVVSTKDFPFDDYLKARLLHLIISVFYTGQAFTGFFKFMDESGADVKGFLFSILGKFSSDQHMASIIEGFVQETKRELFDSEAALRDYYSTDENFEKLINGTLGANLLQKYTSLSYIRHGTDLARIIKSAVLDSLPVDGSFAQQLDDIAEYYRLSFDKFIDPDRKGIVSKGTFHHDVGAWLVSGEKMSAFALSPARELAFHTPAEQYQMVEDYFERYGTNEQSLGKILTRLWIVEMLRKPVDNTSLSGAGA